MKNPVVKILVVIAVITLIVLFRLFHLETYLTLANLKAQHGTLLGYYHSHPAEMIAAYVALYIGVAALSIPGAAVLTIAGGAIFGFWVGLLVASFASTIGATCAFLASRLLFRETIQSKFREKLAGINEGIRKEGAFYLFSLRLIPIFPFFVINLVMGLSPIRLATFFFVSQVGMLPGTAAYVNAGTQLGSIESLSGILSFRVLVSFAILAVLPFLSKFVINTIRARKVLRLFSKPKSFDYNLVVIGAGSGGLVSSYIAAALKSRVALIEKHKMGGDCLNTGCVPSKALIRSAKILSYAKRAKEFGFTKINAEFDFAHVMERIKRVVTTVEPHDSIERYTGLGVECIEGAARIKSPFEVEVNGRTLTTRSIILATGASPLVPPILGLDRIKYLTSDNIWDLRELPKRLLVLGGGPIGCELAQAFRRFGSEVMIVEMIPRIMAREDEDVSLFVTERFNHEGIKVLTSHKAKSFHQEQDQKWLICESNGKEIRIEFDEVLLALGRKANVKGFGLEEIGVGLSKRGTIEVDEFMRTNVPNIYACGDVAGPYQFTHTAAHQAWYASVNALVAPFKKFKADYRVIPWCTFTDPEVARVGLSESEAKEQGIAFEVTRYGIDELDRAIAEEEGHGFVKVLTVPGKDRILGATIVGSHAGDIIAEYVAAMKHGFGMNKILGTVHIYPTLAEANKYAAGVWKRTHAPKAALEFIEKIHTWRRA